MTTAPPVPASSHRLGVARSRVLWRRWVAAYAVGEFIGLGLTGLAGAVIVWALDPRWPVLAAVALIASGAVEDTVAGIAQWRALRDPIAVTARRWTPATVVGALAAWAADASAMMLSLAFAVGALVAGAVAGAIHGIVLVTMAAGRVTVRDGTAKRRRVGGGRVGHK